MPDGARLRVGIINIMPRAETYEAYLTRPLLASRWPVEPRWIRLESHSYTSSDAEHVRRHYSTFDQLLAQTSIDGLILTGAPVEELEFEDVRYFSELVGVLEHVRRRGIGTLGLCWGGMALAWLVGVPKVRLRQKLFGVFEQRRLDEGHVLTERFGERFWCAHSRHSGILDAELVRARDAGLVNLLAHGEEAGYTMFESADGHFVAHLGHPEYAAERLLDEWQRDSARGRSDVERPRNFDVDHPIASWTSHCDQLFDNWLTRLGRARSGAGK